MDEPVRSFPILIPPVRGEALDSWFEALGHRLTASWGDVLEATGLSTREAATTAPWLITLSPERANAVHTATGIDIDQLHAMTLSYYNGSGLRIDPATGALSRAFPWGRSRFSRYCPACLRETGGRWQLFWRLGWAFACTEHRCLLVDQCPTCGQRQRKRPIPANLIPQPGRCTSVGSDALGQSAARCNADLTNAVAASFPAAHPALQAQALIRTVIETCTVQFGLYRQNRTNNVGALADIRAIAARILAHGDDRILQQAVPADLFGIYRQQSEQHRTQEKAAARGAAKPGLAAPARAVSAAVGVTAALRILNTGTIDDAASTMRPLITISRSKGRAVNPTTVTTWGRGTTEVLAGVQLAALEPVLNPSDQLRCRSGTALPNKPSLSEADTESLAAKMPAELWAPWALRLQPSGVSYPHLAVTLPSLVLLVNSKATLSSAAEAMGYVDGQQLSYLLQVMEDEPCWKAIRQALIRLAQHLHTHPSPIDYARRRTLDYSTLLPDQLWHQICRTTATARGGTRKVDTLRCHLYSLISGNPVNSAPWFTNTSGFRARMAALPTQLTPALTEAITTEARTFLRRRRIEEPVSWHPPVELLRELRLPGHDPAAIDVHRLHGMVQQQRTVTDIAENLNTSIEALRCALVQHPAPELALSTDQQRCRGIAAAKLQQALPRRRLIALYVEQKLSLRQIGARYGADRKTVARLAKSYGIALRPPQRTRRLAEIDKDWLYTEYITNRRTLPDLAAEKGMSTMNMSRWAKRHGIALRRRGGPSHTSNLQASATARQAPEILRPALAGIGGAERLSRFVRTSTYPTFSAAAAALKLRQPIICGQIARLETELGGPLIERAERGRPMALTELGSAVIDAHTAWLAAQEKQNTSRPRESKPRTRPGLPAQTAPAQSV